jgi:hypothetical protein
MPGALIVAMLDVSMGGALPHRLNESPTQGRHVCCRIPDEDLG